MRVVMNGNTQNLYTLMTGIDARFPQVNVRQLQVMFPSGTYEAGNAGATVKIGSSAVNGADNVGVEDLLEEGDRQFKISLAEDISLKNKWVRGSANNTILWIETEPK